MVKNSLPCFNSSRAIASFFLFLLLSLMVSRLRRKERRHEEPAQLPGARLGDLCNARDSNLIPNPQKSVLLLRPLGSRHLIPMCFAFASPRFFIPSLLSLSRFLSLAFTHSLSLFLFFVVVFFPPLTHSSSCIHHFSPLCPVCIP